MKRTGFAAGLRLNDCGPRRVPAPSGDQAENKNNGVGAKTVRGPALIRLVLQVFLASALLFGAVRTRGVIGPPDGIYLLEDATFYAFLSERYPDHQFHLASTSDPLIEPLGLRPGTIPHPAQQVYLFGSGLRHHYALLTLRDEAYVVVFDAHTDMRGFGDGVDCGNWIRHLIKTDPVKRVIIAGVSAVAGETYLNPRQPFLSREVLESGRVEIYRERGGWSFVPWPVATAMRGNPSVVEAVDDRIVNGGALRWSRDGSGRLPRDTTVSISVDLDCLVDRGFRCEWDEGQLTKDRLLDMERRVRATNRVQSINICGYTAEQSPTEKAELARVVDQLLATTGEER